MPITIETELGGQESRNLKHWRIWEEGGSRDACPPGQILFIFMRFSGKNGHIVDWRLPLRVGTLSEKSWIHSAGSPLVAWWRQGPFALTGITTTDDNY